MSPEEVALVEGSVTALQDRREALAAAFYRRLFSALPEVRSLFGSDMAAQGEKFTTMLAYLVRSLGQWSVVEPAARLSGLRHAGYGVTTAHYRVAGESLLGALAEVSGADWTEETEQAWRSAYALLAELMMSGAHDAELDTSRP